MKTQHTCIGNVSIIYLAVSLLVCNSSAQTSTANLAPPPAGFATRLDYLKSFTNENDVMRAYREGLIGKNEAMAAHLLIGNLKQQDFYGKVIDQYGQPINGATVTGYLRSDEGFGINDEKVEEFKTQTDAEGLFQFTGLHGARFGQKVSKDGYEMGLEGYIRQTGSKTSPNDRATFMMWKLRGAEPMVHTEIQAGLACNGTPRSFNLLTGQRLSNGGDLVATLIRNPVDIDRRKPFDWTLTLSISDGGLIEIQGGYANEAPEKDYQQTITISMPANTNNWTPSIQRSYFFKSRGGQNYGKVTINLMANYEPPPTHFEIDAYVNPAGSRNLEIDPKKVMTAHP
jgi:hypothetical protein